MSIFFKVIGVILMILPFIEYSYTSLVSIVFTIAFGTALITIGSLLQRVKYLENHLNVSYESNAYNNTNLPQKECPNCGNIHDFDYPKCPNCKYLY